MVKALILNSNGNFPCRFEPCSQRSIFFIRKLLRRIWEYEPILVFAKNWDWRTKDSQLLFLEKTCRRQRLETTSTTILRKKSKISASKQNVRGRNQIPSKKDKNQKSYDSSVVKASDLKSDAHFPRTIEPCPQPPISFSEKYSEEVGNTNQYFCSQTIETDEPKTPIYFSWKGVVHRSVWRRPARQSSAKKRTIMQAKISPGTKLNFIKIRTTSKDLW